ncbi:putative ubiquitinyl hydrolase 1 [Helianthus debilis subsp. tardiflorus]
MKKFHGFEAALVVCGFTLFLRDFHPKIWCLFILTFIHICLLFIRVGKSLVKRSDMVSLFSHQTGGIFVSRRKHEPAHYMLKIESFSILSEAETWKIESDVFEAGGHKWLTLFFITFSSLKCSFYNSLTSFQFFFIRRLDLYPNGNDEENKGNHISLYAVICDTESCLKGWEVCVDVCFFVYDHIHHNYVTIQDTNGRGTRFHEKKTTCGFDKLIPMESFMESTNGFLFNDSCVFGAEVITVPVPEFTQLDRCLSMIKPLATKNTYTWTINNFSAVTESVLYSEIFKVGNVKWQLELYPEGDNIGKGTHLSIFLAVHDAASFADGSVPHFNVTGLYNIITKDVIWLILVIENNIFKYNTSA